MCLAIPARIIEVINEREGLVEWSRLRMKVGLDLVPEAKTGDWVLVHTGYAIEVVDPQEAARSIQLFEEMAADE